MSVSRRGAEHWLAVHGASWYNPYGVALPGKSKWSSKKRKSFVIPTVELSRYELWNHPVVHVSYNDAAAYCAWLSTHSAMDTSLDGSSAPLGVSRLPTEEEWEYAARGGLVNHSYPWGERSLRLVLALSRLRCIGNDFELQRMNIWEQTHRRITTGPKFPDPASNLLFDGYMATAPVLSYAPNAYGLHNMLGNVWEWCEGGSPKAVRPTVYSLLTV